MSAIVLTNNEEYVITLKEITDLIGARHNDAMKKVEELAQEDGFGTLRKTRIVYNDKGQEIDTYQFTKKQAIAVGARLNNAMLMKVINRLEELEVKKQPVLTQQEFTMKAIAEMANGFLGVETQIKEVKGEIAELKNSTTLDYSQQNRIQKQVKIRVTELRALHNLGADYQKKIFQGLHRVLWDVFQVASYKDIPKMRFNEAIHIIQNSKLNLSL